MDFNGKIFHPLPFYMTHPGYLGANQEGAILRDLEYLQQTYPKEVKQFQRRIAEVLDKLDYEGSMIYDEYPDRYTLQRLSESIIHIMRQEEENAGGRTQTYENIESVEESLPGMASEELWTHRQDLVQVLLCNEIYKRRHGGRRGQNFFRTFH